MAGSGKKLKTPGDKLLRDALRVLHWRKNELLEGEDEAARIAEEITNRAGTTRVAQLTSRGSMQTTVKPEIVDQLIKNSEKFLQTNKQGESSTRPQSSQDLPTTTNDNRFTDVNDAEGTNREAEQQLIGPVGRRTNEEGRTSLEWGLPSLDSQLELHG